MIILARMFKSTVDIVYGVNLTTVFEDSENTRSYKVGDVIEGLRYINNEEIEKVSGRLKSVGFSTPSTLNFNPADPKDTLSQDMLLKTLNLDASEQYNAKSVAVPVHEVVEFDGEENVTRMKYSPYYVANMELKYSNYKIDHQSIEVGDTFTNVRIMNPSKPGDDITGKFKVIAFAYTDKTLKPMGIALENVDTGDKIIADFKNILELNEVFNYEIPDAEAIAEVISNLADGDTLTISNEIDTTGNMIHITQNDIHVMVDQDIVADNSHNGGIRITGTADFMGEGKIIGNTPYDASHGTGVISVRDQGEVVFNGSGVDAVIEDDPVNKGQFGVCAYQDAKVTINAGEFRTGWYCVTGNGSSTSANSVTTINGGKLTSVADYAIYHPHAGKLVINGGIIEGAAGAIAAQNGTIEINGGTIKAIGGGDTGNASDGTGGLGNAAINLNARYGDIVCRITGGTFIATAEDTIMINIGSAHNVDLQITGGKFTTKPKAEWVPEGYTIVDLPDGLFEVVRLLQE